MREYKKVSPIIHRNKKALSGPLDGFLLKQGINGPCDLLLAVSVSLFYNISRKEKNHATAGMFCVRNSYK